jgi:hypothetical protein
MANPIKREFAFPDKEKPLPVATFQRSLRKWQAEWKAQKARARQAREDEEAPCEPNPVKPA